MNSNIFIAPNYKGYGCISISNMFSEDIGLPRRPYGGLAIYYLLSNEFKVQLVG